MNTVSATLGLNRSIAETRQQITDLQQQIATGKKVQTYGDLGLQSSQNLSLRAELSQIDGYNRTIDQVGIRLDVLTQSLDHIRELATTTKSDALTSGFVLNSNGQTVFQTEVGARFDEVASILNIDLDGRHLLGGRETENDPVVSATEILNGSGNRAGFEQIVSERRQADLGADGLGRLVTGGPEAAILGGVVGAPADIGGAPAAGFTIDIGGNPQNFDISDAGSDTLSALEAAIDAAFGADVASIIGGNQLQITATNATDTITITDIDAGAAALAGLTTGATASPTATASISEDVDGSPFGFKLNGATSTLAGTTLSGPAGSPQNLDVSFSSTLPNDGENIQITFDLPDGTTHDLRLTARSGGPLLQGEFLIGADENETAVNFQSAITTELQTEAQRSLSAASLFSAANDFFDFDAGNPPQRVDGPPFDSATALRDGLESDTVYWYQGEDSATSARTSSVAKVDDSITISYGARANEDALRQVLKTFAAISVETFSASDVNAADRNHELQLRANAGLSFANGEQGVDDIITELTVGQTIAGSAQERHTTSDGYLRDLVGQSEEIDLFEVSAQILSLSSRVQASLQVTASLGQLSILNFL